MSSLHYFFNPTETYWLKYANTETVATDIYCAVALLHVWWVLTVSIAKQDQRFPAEAHKGCVYLETEYDKRFTWCWRLPYWDMHAKWVGKIQDFVNDVSSEVQYIPHSSWESQATSKVSVIYEVRLLLDLYGISYRLTWNFIYIRAAI